SLLFTTQGICDAIAMAGSRNFTSMVHPNAVVARRELERQEQRRLQRLSEVKVSSSTASVTRRACSAPRVRESRSRPTSAARPSSARQVFEEAEVSPAAPSRPKLSPDEIQQQLIRQKLGPYQAAAAYAAAAAKGTVRQEQQVPVSFLTSPQKRMEDAWLHLPAASEEERQALYEELQGWYFCPPSAEADAEEARSRPPVGLLEEAAAAVRAKSERGYRRPPIPS
ncbi:unnamed protein product, partial [Effrenium voratum]